MGPSPSAERYQEERDGSAGGSAKFSPRIPSMKSWLICRWRSSVNWELARIWRSSSARVCTKRRKASRARGWYIQQVERVDHDDVLQVARLAIGRAGEIV